MLSIPIISEFDNKGIKKAVKEFKQLETTGQKVGFVLKKAGQAAALGFAAIGAAAVAAGAALWSFAKDAMADAKSQRQLVASIRAVTKATDAQIKATEDWITKTQLALGVADTDLRQGLARLVRSTKDTTKAQALLNTALDVAAATGKPLEAVVNALGKAYDGNNTALARLGLGFSKAELKAKPFAEIAKDLDKRFGGSAQRNAATFEGKLARLSETFGELKESLGTIVLDYLVKLADFGIKLADILGAQGLGGAVDYLVNSLKQLAFYDKQGNLNALGKTLRFATEAINYLSRGAGITFGALTGNVGMVKEAVTTNRATLNTLNRYSDPFAMQAVNGALPRVTINFNGVVTDPVATGREIKRILATVDRRTGSR